MGSIMRDVFFILSSVCLLQCIEPCVAEENVEPNQESPTFRNHLWEATDFVWNLGIASACDIGLDENPEAFFKTYFDRSKHFKRSAYEHLVKGNVVWIRAHCVGDFFKQILPEIKEPIVLVINDGDESFPSGCLDEASMAKLVENDCIIHIFAQNCDYKGKSEKVSHLPIGIDFHTVAYRGGFWGEKGSPKEQEGALKQILKELSPTYARKKRAYVNFQLNDTMRYGDCKRYLEFGEDRTSIFQTLLKTKLIDYGDNMKRTDLWKVKGEYAFSVSPHGNGIDCHRTWEDLVLGNIVIVKTSSLDPIYEGLPVVIVKEWSEVTEENLDKWLKQYGDAFTNPSYKEKLTNAYWLNKIKAAAQPYKNGTAQKEKSINIEEISQ